MLPPTPDFYRREAQACREAAALDPDRYVALRRREAADEYDRIAELFAAESIPSQAVPGGSRRQARQQPQTRGGQPAPTPSPATKEVRQPCAVCGQPAWLTRIEPAQERDYDLRTFECGTCGATRTVQIKFR
jgi:hypothetical protein